MSATTDRELLLIAARSFCGTFANKKPLGDVLGHFSLEAVCLEHGLQQLAPFLGRRFTGLSGVQEYFGLIADLLSYEDMRFSDYVVDAEVSKVSVRGQASFTWKSTGNIWQEIFTYTLEFDEQLKVKVYEVWADSGAAYLASRGELS